MLQRVALSLLLLGALVLGLQLVPQRADAGDDCSEIVLKGDAGPNRTAHFIVDVIPGIDDVTLRWSVSDGGIEQGQDTPEIIVSDISGNSVTVTVEVGGLNDGCPYTASETVDIS